MLNGYYAPLWEQFLYEKGYNNKARIKMYIRSIEVASL